MTLNGGMKDKSLNYYFLKPSQKLKRKEGQEFITTNTILNYSAFISIITCIFNMSVTPDRNEKKIRHSNTI